MTSKGFYELRIYTENSELKKVYQEKVRQHNDTYNSEPHPDSGFDLIVPNSYTLPSESCSKIDHEVACAMVYDEIKPTAYYLYPRSSTGTKTPLRLANSVGIIDSGYRGNIIAAFDNREKNDYILEKGKRVVQLCSPTLEPFTVSVVDCKSELGKTTRNSGGFGSTGE